MKQQTKKNEPNYAKPDTPLEDILPTQIKDHNYCQKTSKYINIDQQYADDIRSQQLTLE
jgi:hypothetical protein